MSVKLDWETNGIVLLAQSPSSVHELQVDVGPELTLA